MTISMDKKYKTRDGRDVKILCVDGVRKAPVCGIIYGTTSSQGDSGSGYYHSWRADGSDPLGCNEDALTEVVQRIKRQVWLEVYAERVFVAADIRDRNARMLARVRVDIDCEEGYGLTQAEGDKQ